MHRADASSRLRIIVLGYIVRGPLGGMVWSNLQYLRGLTKLGHDVYFVEDSEDYPACYDPQRNKVGIDPTCGLSFAHRELTPAGVGNRWAYWNAHTGEWMGPAAASIEEICKSAELVLNLCGVNPLRPWLQSIPVRVFVDEDPAFTQIRHLTDKTARTRASQHTHFLSFAANMGKPECTIPDDGFAWNPTRQPVDLEALAASPGRPRSRFTTVMLWDSYPAREFAGTRFGMKSESFAPILDLPAQSGSTLELAVGGPTAPRKLLAAHGWRVRDPRPITRSVPTYLRYIRESLGELSAAKAGYVTTRSGWFSERSVAYLATGRPVIVEDTGFTSWLNAQGGVVPFSAAQSAVEAIADVTERYEYHCRAARDVAEEYFDARRVLREMIDRVMTNTKSTSNARKA
jgi:hypothetical protein